MEEGQWGDMRKWSLYDFRLCWGWDAEVKKKKKKKNPDSKWLLGLPRWSSG